MAELGLTKLEDCLFRYEEALMPRVSLGYVRHDGTSQSQSFV